MNKFFIFNIGLLLSLSSCEDFLDTNSPSVVDSDFVYSNSSRTRAALDYAYRKWTDASDANFFGDGLFYAADLAGSDIERHPESFNAQLQRHYPETLYRNGTYASSYNSLSYQKEDSDGAYAQMFKVISLANSLITSFEEKTNFDEMIKNATSPSNWTQMYGEAIALRATAYRELIKNYGDIPYITKFGLAVDGLNSRDSIYDCCITDLLRVEPLMYKVGEIPGIDSSHKRLFSKTYVQGLIGRICLDAAGYQTRRNDFNYKDGKGNVLTFEKKGIENNNSFYGRRSDYKDLYKIAKDAYERIIEEGSGSAVFHSTDPRGTSDEKGRTYNNPYQYFFNQMLSADVVYADESIVEYPVQQGKPREPGNRGYASARPSSGPEKNGYPGKAYAQVRINPAFYFGIFDPNDMRRDVCVAITGSTGKGIEKLIPFVPNSKAEGGGMSLNKYDENRQATPWTSVSGRSGINGPYMRLSEIYLGYAEACTVLGDDITARLYLSKIRERSFPTGKAEVDQFIVKSGGMLRAIIEERGFEFAGEGDRRWTLIRTGFLPDAIRRIKELTKKMIDGLSSEGYYTFENGNTISAYVWTKLVDAKQEYGYRLTTQCPSDKDNDPVLYPGWRGQNDDWTKFGLDYETENPKTNLAIKGLFDYIEPGSEEAKLLENDGYVRENYGIDLVEYYDEYYTYLFYDYDYQKAPIYLWPFTPNVLKAGNFTNGYGFK